MAQRSPSTRAPRLNSVRAAIRLMNADDRAPADVVARQRRLVADLCRMLGDQVRRGGQGVPALPAPAAVAGPVKGIRLSPRMRQTLERLLTGDSEKEIAR